MNEQSLTGQVALVTGANTGIGKATALTLARRGATTILACRDMAKGERARDEIRDDVGGTAVRVVHLDLADLRSVEECAGEVATATPGLDILVNNGGATMRSREVTAEGAEKTYAANHLGHYALTRLLLNHLRRPGRVISVSSMVHRFVDGVRFHDPTFEHGWSALGAYGNAKLAQILFTRELARRYGGTGVHAHAVHPGFVGSDFYRSRGRPRLAETLTAPLVGLIAKSPAEGAATTIHLATSEEALRTNGGYWINRRPARPSAAARDHAAARRLWETDETQVVQAGVPMPHS